MTACEVFVSDEGVLVSDGGPNESTKEIVSSGAKESVGEVCGRRDFCEISLANGKAVSAVRWRLRFQCSRDHLVSVW